MQNTSLDLTDGSSALASQQSRASSASSCSGGERAEEPSVRSREVFCIPSSTSLNMVLHTPDLAFSPMQPAALLKRDGYRYHRFAGRRHARLAPAGALEPIQVQQAE